MKYFSRARICLSCKIFILSLFVVFLLMGVVLTKTDRCVKNARYTKCATACPLTCDNLENPPDFCGTVCMQGCQCEEGFVLSRTRRCVKPEDCEKSPSNVRRICVDKPDAGFCGGRRMMWNFNQSTGNCQQFRFRGCGGNGNRYKTEKECLEKCKGDVCGENERYNECGTSCPLTCENYEIKDRVCTQECKEGCECEKGFVRRSDGKCIRPEYCPNNYVPPLSVVIEDDRGNTLKGIAGPYNEGESPYLVCFAKGHPTPTLTWWSKGKLIDESFYQRFGLVTNLLIFYNLQRADFMVEFTCQATYLLPENITQSINVSAKMDLNMKPLYVRITTPQKPVKSGEDITLVCETSGSRPEAEISWWLGDKLIEDAIQTFFSERGSSEWNITYSSIQLSPGIDDNGKVIICKARNRKIDYVKMQDTWILNIVHYNICGPNERYNECGTHCPLTCENYDIPDRMCPDVCDEGCECEVGFVRGDEGKCVRLEDCRKEQDKIRDANCSDCPDPGVCEAMMTRFYYDSEDGHCKEFIYGGCGGNTNNFETEEDCKAACGDNPEAQIKQELV